MNDITKLLVAFAAGALVGATVGVLFAPDKGSETRRKIGAKGKEMGDLMKSRLQAGKEKLGNLREGIKDTLKENSEEYV